MSRGFSSSFFRFSSLIGAFPLRFGFQVETRVSGSWSKQAAICHWSSSSHELDLVDPRFVAFLLHSLRVSSSLLLPISLTRVYITHSQTITNSEPSTRPTSSQSFDPSSSARIDSLVWTLGSSLSFEPSTPTTTDFRPSTARVDGLGSRDSVSGVRKRVNCEFSLPIRVAFRPRFPR